MFLCQQDSNETKYVGPWFPVTILKRSISHRTGHSKDPDFQRMLHENKLKINCHFISTGGDSAFQYSMQWHFEECSKVLGHWTSHEI